MNNTKRTKAMDEDHQTSISAGILMSSSHDFVPKSITKFTASDLFESTNESALRKSMVRNESSFGRKKKLEMNPSSTKPIKFSYTMTGDRKLRNVVSFFKKDNDHRVSENKRVGVSDFEDINHLRSQECCVCLTNPPDCVLMECGHGSLCFSCGETLIRGNQVCPLCRLDIKAVLQIDLSSHAEKTLKVLRSLFKEGKREDRNSLIPSTNLNSEFTTRTLPQQSDSISPEPDVFTRVNRAP